MSAISQLNRLKQFTNNFSSERSLRRSSFNILVSQSVFVFLFLIADVFFARSFSKTDFGVWKQLILIINLGIPLLSFGFPEGFKYYIAIEPEKKESHVTQVLSILISSSFIFFILTLLFGKFLIGIFFKQSFVETVVNFLPFIFLVFTANKILRYLVINNKRTNALLIGSAAALVVGTILICLTVYTYKQYQSFYLFVAATFVLVTYLISFVNIITKLQFKITFKLSKAQIIKYLKYGFPLYLASFIGIIIINVDKAIVNSKDSLDAFAVYSVGAIEIPVFGMISASVSQSYFPVMVEQIKKGIKQEAKKIWLNSTVRVSYITYPIIMVLMFSSSFIIHSLFGLSYSNAVPVFKTYLLVALWRNNYYGALISASGKSKWITFYSIITLVLNVIGAFLLYSYSGMYGVAYSCFIATSITNIFYLVHEKLFQQYVKTVVLNPFIFIMIVIIIIGYFSNI